MGEIYPITGIIPETPGETIPTRQEITTWCEDVANKYQVSLFMRALTRLMETDIDRRESYFQIAGIHSYPLVGWDGEARAPDPKPEVEPGYRAHNKVTFPTWHRPYMLLYEQILHKAMLKIVEEWMKDNLLDCPEQKMWNEAARLFRLPYWDWARNQKNAGQFGIPQVCTWEIVSIISPGGKIDKSFPNPLVKFRNPKNVAMEDPSMGQYAIKDHDPNNKDEHTNYHIMPWSKCVATSRYGILANPQSPTGKQPDWVNGVNDWRKCNTTLEHPEWYGQSDGSLADAVKRLLSADAFDSWETFASTKWNPPNVEPIPNREFLSLEYIHNMLHISGEDIPKKPGRKPDPDPVLGLGHMSDVPVSAFDPIFWLLHCNFDRLFAIWQTLNWDKWFDRPGEDDPKPSGHLLPFHYDEQGGRWDSTRARCWKELHYQYDDLVPKPNTLQDSDQYRTELREHINTLYPGISAIIQEDRSWYTLLEKPQLRFNDYIINVVYDRYALGGTAYTMLFFLGKPPQDLSSYRQSENFVGLLFTFSSPVEACDNCAQQRSERVLSKAQIPLTLPLINKVFRPIQPGPDGQIPPAQAVSDLSPEQVETLLRDPVEGLT